MIENNPSNVSSAFDILLEEIEAEIDFMSKAGAKAFQDRALDRVKEACQKVEDITAFRDRVAVMRQEWESMAKGFEDGDEETSAARRNLGRLQRGLRTRESQYYQPILQALQEGGGAAKASEVLEMVLDLVKPILRDVDYEPLSSDPDNPRWRNTAQWARAAMVKEGLLKADSPRGIWEMTEKGERHLLEKPLRLANNP